MSNPTDSWQKFEPGEEIGVLEGCGRHVYQLDQDTWFAYIQHDCLKNSSTYGRLFMRDGRWRGAMKAIITNYKEALKGVFEIEKLIILRKSKSGKSVIVKAVFKEN